MFNVSGEAQQKIQNIQYQALLSLKVDPDYVVKRNTEEIRFPGATIENLEEQYSQIKNFYFILPEYHYDTSFEYFKFLMTCNVTKFDRTPFLQRFSNIIPLCHEFYTNGNPALKRNIIVTSLPFLNLNGICHKHESSDIVFLNEGLLSTIPAIYKFLMPLLNPQLFFRAPERDYLDMVLRIIFQSSFLRNTYSDLKDSLSLKYPNASEVWLLKSMLIRQLEENVANGQGHQDDAELSVSDHPLSSLPLDWPMAHFLACRGAFVFLLGHEFSHVYGNHIAYKLEGNVNLRDQKMLEEISIRFQKDFSRYEGMALLNKNFCLHQPLEEEADAHGIQCVINYCIKNHLTDEKAICVLIGAIATFIVMEIHDCLSAICNLDIKTIEDFHKMDPILRNVLFYEEHPAPVSRLDMALRHEQLQNNSIAEILPSLNGELIVICNQLDSHIFRHSQEIKKIISSSDILNYDFDSIFDNRFFSGVSDFTQKFYSKIKTNPLC